MLTGMMTPSAGEIRIKGYNMATETAMGRKHIGFCPQHDILFDNLTVYQHLKLFAMIKGVPKDSIEVEICYLAEKLQLKSKLDCLSMTLSGGQKRCLSVAIAFIGRSEAVILDEPSTGKIIV